MMLYRATIVMVGIIAAYVSVAITLSTALAGVRPDLSLQFWPWHAVAYAKRANAIIDPEQKSAATVARSRADAVTALQRDPLRADAVRNLALAMAAQGNDPDAVRLFDYGQRLSRRDPATQLWAIERQVAADNVPGALKHYDHVLRVSPGMQPMLFAVLSTALSDPDLALPIARTAAKSAVWRPMFLNYTAQQAAPRDVARLFIALARLGTPANAEQEKIVTNRLLQQGDYAMAGQLYRLSNPGWSPGAPATQVDGSFAQVTGGVFDWQLQDGAELTGNADAPLQLSFGEATAPVVARLMLLPAGQYRLTGSLTELPGDGKLIVLARCANMPARQIGSLVVSQKGTFALPMNVPSACPAQTLQLQGQRYEDAADRILVGPLTLER